MRVTATQTPASAATMGTIQTNESRVRFLATCRDSGTYDTPWLGSGMLHLSAAGCIPDQPGVERLYREHGQHHDCCEEEQTGARLDGHERLELYQRRGEGIDEHVDHR